MTKIYLANGLFNESDLRYNEYIAQLLREGIDDVEVFVPQEQGINDKTSYADSQLIYKLDRDNLISSDILVAIIDGVEVDSGVALEIGLFAAQRGNKIIGLYTDPRQLGRDNKKKIDALIKDGTENQFMYRNLMVIGAIKENGEIINSSSDLVNTVKCYI